VDCCPARAWLPAHGPSQRSGAALVVGGILSEQDAASYCPGGVFPVGTAGIELLAGRPRDVSVAVAVLAVLFGVKFALL
jgi:hypothetical protein